MSEDPEVTASGAEGARSPYLQDYTSSNSQAKEKPKSSRLVRRKEIIYRTSSAFNDDSDAPDVDDLWDDGLDGWTEASPFLNQGGSSPFSHDVPVPLPLPASSYAQGGRQLGGKQGYPSKSALSGRGMSKPHISRLAQGGPSPASITMAPGSTRPVHHHDAVEGSYEEGDDDDDPPHPQHQGDVAQAALPGLIMARKETDRSSRGGAIHGLVSLNQASAPQGSGTPSAGRGRLPTATSAKQLEDAKTRLADNLSLLVEKRDRLMMQRSSQLPPMVVPAPSSVPPNVQKRKELLGPWD